jgi:hypothetical protein
MKHRQFGCVKKHLVLANLDTLCFNMLQLEDPQQAALFAKGPDMKAVDRAIA